MKDFFYNSGVSLEKVGLLTFKLIGLVEEKYFCHRKNRIGGKIKKNAVSAAAPPFVIPFFFGFLYEKPSAL